MFLFLPIGDDTWRYRLPYVTFVLIGANVVIHILAFIYTLKGGSFDHVVMSFGSLQSGFDPLRALSAGFLHVGWLHLLGNMWFLFLFGSSVEGKLGHVWMAVTYTFCLLVSDLVAHVLGPSYYEVSLGASGAVGGVVGTYWFLFSRAEVEFAYFVLLLKGGAGTVWLGIHWAVAWIFGWDFIWWLLEWTGYVQTGISHSAHLGGLVTGLCCGLLLRHFGHITLDGDDMYTRVVAWWLKRHGRSGPERSRTPAPPIPEVAPPFGAHGSDTTQSALPPEPSPTANTAEDESLPLD
jgi:membrane associated rhomboid family serine protease